MPGTQIVPEPPCHSLRPFSAAFFQRPFALLAVFVLSAVWLLYSSAPSLAQGEGERIAAASYPVFLFTRYLNEGRNHFNVELMTSPGTGCPHEFNPRPQDLERLSTTHILVKNGLNLEIYLDRALAAAPPDVYVIDASEGVPTMPNNIDRLKVTGDPSNRDNSPNPHIFFSTKNASLMTANIAKGLSAKDPDGAAHYQERLRLFQESMLSLDKEVEKFKNTRSGYKVVTSHGFMDYFASELGLEVIADIEPEPDVAPTPPRLTDLAGIIVRERVAALFLEPEADFAQGKTLGSETGIQVLVVDPATAGAGDPPVDYFQQVVRKDIEAISAILPANVTAK
jgi:ABC-type Zn uptake system ZnuABC Zn-binding protein ZnuA